MADDPRNPQTAVWYFVAATFISCAPALFFRGSDALWLSLGSLGLGAVVLITGFVVALRERRLRLSRARA